MLRRLFSPSLPTSLAQHTRRMSTWDPLKGAHGRPDDLPPVPDEPPPSASRSITPTSDFPSGASAHYDSSADGPRSSPATWKERSDMVQFQNYARERLRQIAEHMPQHSSTQKRVELNFLEEQVVEDVMPRKQRRLRDPLKDVPVEDIVHTNLALLNRFVSESGGILPRKLTGVAAHKQQRLAKAIKRAQNMALMPIVWKDLKYRHASFAYDFAPDRKINRTSSNDEFADAPDIRFPGTKDTGGLNLYNLGRAKSLPNDS